MKVRIENGITIISTGDSVGGMKNKNNSKGVTQHKTPSGIKYRSEITYKHRKYCIAICDTAEEAAALWLEADNQRKAGTFPEWIEKQLQLKKEKRNKHGAAGIIEFNSKYQAKIRINKKDYYLGTWADLADAIATRKEAERQLANGSFDEWFAELRNKK